MKKIIAASILFAACGKADLPESVSIVVENEKQPAVCLTEGCSEITTTTIDKNGVNTVQTEEPCDDEEPVVVASPAPSPVVVASPAPVVAVTPAPTPTPFVPHYTPEIHPLPSSFVADFVAQAVVEFDVNDNGVIDTDEYFSITFNRLPDQSVVTQTVYMTLIEKYWYPNEFVNDKKFTENSVQPWDVIIRSNSSFFAWAPLGESPFRATFRCSNSPIFSNGANCVVGFHSVDSNQSFLTNKPIQFSDGTVSTGAKGKHLSYMCIFGGNPSGNIAIDRCWGDSQ